MHNLHSFSAYCPNSSGQSQSTKTSDELASNGESCDRKRKSKDNKSDISKSSTTPSEAGGKKKSNRFRKFREGLGQAVSSVGEAIRPKQKSEEGVAQDQQTQERPGKLKRLWNGLGLLAHGIKFVVTKPRELLYAGLRKLIPSISAEQLNFLMIVLMIIFAFKVYTAIVLLNSDTTKIQRETQDDVKAIREQMTKQHGQQHRRRRRSGRSGSRRTNKFS